MSKEYFRKRAKEYSERPEEQMGYLIMVIMEQEQDLFSIKDDSARKSALLNDQNKTIEVQNGTIAAQNDTIAALQAEIARTKLAIERIRQAKTES